MFLINLIPLHVFTLMICGRYSHKVYVAYSTVYALGTILSMQISFVGFQPVQTSEHMMVKIYLLIPRNIGRYFLILLLNFKNRTLKSFDY